MINSGRDLYNEYRSRHSYAYDEWDNLTRWQQRKWNDWADRGGNVQTGVILKKRPTNLVYMVLQ